MRRLRRARARLCGERMVERVDIDVMGGGWHDGRGRQTRNEEVRSQAEDVLCIGKHGDGIHCINVGTQTTRYQ